MSTRASDERSPDPWARIDELFDEALELHPDEWHAFVSQHTSDDRSIGETVLRLLEAARRSTGFLERPGDVVPGEFVTTVTDALEEESSSPSRRIGPYRILRPIGRDGSGTVYLAEREEDGSHPRVALRLLRSDRSTDHIVQRFADGREALISLSHPGIAKLIDGGTAEDGRPFLVTEYIEGQPITAYCDEQRLGLPERLRLFIEVAAAVQYAHRNLVIHRDLQPSKVLVTSEGSVKLLDTGVAELIAPIHGDVTARHGQPMTLSYASPEQIRGEKTTTATDVYQLGVLLFVLLTGRSPYPSSSTSDESVPVEQWITDTDPVRPSATVVKTRKANEDEVSPAELARVRSITPRRLRRALRGDLDAIVLESLRKEPAERYASADALAEDIERHLRGLPVRARPSTARYRARTFVRRYPRLVTFTALALLAVGGYLGFLSRYAAGVRGDVDRAQAEAARTGQTRDFLIDLFQLEDPSATRDRAVTAREILDAGVHRVHGELRDQPEFKAELLTAMATAYLGIAQPSHARPLIEEALELRRAADSADSVSIALNLHQLASATAHSSREEAEPLFERALTAAEQAHGSSHPVVAGVLRDYALNLEPSDPHRWQLLDRALAILRDSSAHAREELASTLAASAYEAPDTIVDGVERLREALTIRRELYGEEDARVAVSLGELARALEERGDAEAADSLIEQALEIHHRIAGEGQTTTLALASDLAGLMRDRGDLGGAESLYREVLRLRRSELAGESAPIALALYDLGNTLVAQGQSVEAESLLRESMSAFSVRDLQRERARTALARALFVQQRFAEAEALLLAGLEEAAGDEAEAERVAQILEPLAELYERWDRSGEAEPPDH